MRRTSLRVSALLLTVLFLATAARDALGVGACPHHDGIPAGALHDPDTANHAEHAAGAEAHHPAALDVPGGDAWLRDGGAPADHGDLCTCVGVCQLTASAPLPDAGAVTWQLLESVSTGATLPEANSTLPGPAPYLLPFATAPPLSR